MELFKNRPLASSLFVFTASAVISTYIIGSKARYILALLLFCIFILSVVLQRKSLKLRTVIPTRTRYLISAVFIVAAMGIIFPSAAFDIKNEKIKEYIGEEGTSVTFTVDDVTYSSASITYANVVLTKINDESCNYLARCSVPGIINKGEIISAAANIFELDTGDFYTFARAGGCLFEIEVTGDYMIEGTDEAYTSDLYENMRNALSVKLNYSAEEGGALLAALALGDRAGIDGSLTLALRRTGASHLLAISGLHLSLLAGIVIKLLSLICIPRRAKYTIGSLFVIFYTFLVGAPSSVVRAAIMTVILFISYIISKEADGITTLFIAVSAFIIASPKTLYDVGFYLSVCATFAILVFEEISRGKKQTRSIKSKIISAISVSLGALISTLPVSMLTFGEMSLITPLSNLILAPFAEFLLMMTPVVLILPIRCGISRMIGKAAVAFVKLTDTISGIDGISVSLSPVWAKIIISVTVGAVLFLLLTRFGSLRRICAMVICGTAAFTVCFAVTYFISNGRVDISTVSYGNDDISLILSDETYLINSTSGKYAIAAEAIAEIREQARCEIDGIVFTHYHNRHVTYLKRIISSIKIDKIYLPMPITENEESLMYVISAICEEHGIEHKLFDGSIEFDSYTFSLMPREYLSRSTHPIISFTVKTSSDSFLYLGESYYEGNYKELAEIAVLNSEHIFIGSHGPVAKEAYTFTSYDSNLKTFAVGMKCDAILTGSAKAAIDIPVTISDGIVRVRLK